MKEVFLVLEPLLLGLYGSLAAELTMAVGLVGVEAVLADATCNDWDESGALGLQLAPPMCRLLLKAMLNYALAFLNVCELGEDSGNAYFIFI